jgi:hypothetical protein
MHASVCLPGALCVQVLLHLDSVQCVLHIGAVWAHPVLEWGLRAVAALQSLAKVRAGEDCGVFDLLAGGATVPWVLV